MKIYCSLLALSAFHSAAAFAPKPIPFVVGRQTTTTTTARFSYLENLGVTEEDERAAGFAPGIHGPPRQAAAATATSYREVFDEDDVAAGVNIGGGGRGAPMVMASDASKTKSLEDRLAALEGGQHTATELMQSAPNDSLAILDTTDPVIVQGSTLKTWSFASPHVDRVQVVLKTEGRPLEADVDLWQGPDNTPHKMRVYLEDGSERPFNVILETPRGPNTISIRNVGQLEFPLEAYCKAEASTGQRPNYGFETPPRTVQGGALRTYPFDPYVDSIQVMLMTDGRPLNARIELLQGPNNNKQVVEVYTEDGRDRPFYMVIETPGSGNVVRVVNSATVEFPMTAIVEPYSISEGAENEAVLGGGGVVIGGEDAPNAGFFTSNRQW